MVSLANLSKKQLRAIHAKDLLSSGTTIKEIKKEPPATRSDIIDITTNRDNPLNEYPKKEFRIWVVDSKKEKIPESETIVRSQHYGQAVDDFLITWNKRKRMGMTIGYPVIQGETV